MAEYVDLSERVSATFYSDEYEEWTQQTVTIADVLDSVCDDYTVLPSAQPEKGYTKADYIMALHKEYGCDFVAAEKAHDMALEYLRSVSKMKG